MSWWKQYDDYFKVPAVSNSFLGQVKSGSPLRPSRALKFGSGFHEMVLEPEKFDIRTYTGRERFKMMKMKRNLSEVAPSHLLKGEFEQELFWEAHGFKCKCKVDIIGESAVIDLKTTAATTEEQFLEMADNYGYYRQGAWYLDVPEVKDRGIDNFVILAVSKAKDPLVFKFEMDRKHGFYLDGKDEYMYLLEKVRQNKKFNHLKINTNAVSV